MNPLHHLQAFIQLISGIKKVMMAKTWMIKFSQFLICQLMIISINLKISTITMISQKKVIKAYLIHHHLDIKILKVPNQTQDIKFNHLIHLTATPLEYLKWNHLPSLRKKTEEKIPNQFTAITPNKRPWPFIVIEKILAFCALVIPIAIVIASKFYNNTGRNPSSFDSSQSIPTELAPNSLSPKPKWNFDTNSIINKDWFVAQAGPNAWDEWDFTLAVSANSSPILEEHWGAWLKEPLNLHPWRTYYMPFQFPDSAEKR
ncbi:hypothetical protein O181_099466 [Austropuccinia psidii MF-1]|uniref:Uncharacterized protein n=1 Tax=Austropuccinia psidii MF-1 TaxID=1389203 RepID=A0A9Q3JCW2_9BASI|nr:hypothetical protein [Austropuccinia psidii MF-1]